jgi:hypothetical protein
MDMTFWMPMPLAVFVLGGVMVALATGEGDVTGALCAILCPWWCLLGYGAVLDATGYKRPNAARTISALCLLILVHFVILLVIGLADRFSTYHATYSPAETYLSAMTMYGAILFFGYGAITMDAVLQWLRRRFAEQQRAIDAIDGAPGDFDEEGE